MYIEANPNFSPEQLFAA
jgi:hypothetical protein